MPGWVLSAHAAIFSHPGPHAQAVMNCAGESDYSIKTRRSATVEADVSTFGRPAEGADCMASCRKPQRSNQRQRAAADGVGALVTAYSQHEESAVGRADAQHVRLGRRPLHRGSIQPRFAANVQSHAFPIAVEWHGGNMRIHAKPSLARSADMFLPTLASKASAECGAPSCVLPCRWYATAAFRPT